MTLQTFNIKSSFNDDTPYQISRAVAAVLIFLNHADYASSKGKHTVLNIDFMRLGEEQPLLSYNTPLYTYTDERSAKAEP